MINFGIMQKHDIAKGVIQSKEDMEKGILSAMQFI